MQLLEFYIAISTQSVTNICFKFLPIQEIDKIIFSYIYIIIFNYIVQEN